MKSLFKNIGIVLGTAFAVSALFPPNPAYAETVSQKQASKIAETFFNAAYGEYVAAPKLEWNGRQLTTDRLFSPFYIYNNPRGGFVIIAADTKAYPILGYSLTGKFSRDKLDDNDRDLLTQYAHEIELIRYDSRSPEQAMQAWRNMPLFINRIIHNPYDTPEYERLTDEEKERLEAIDRRNNSIMLPSAVEFQIYNPERYRDYTLDDVTMAEEEVPFSFYQEFIEQIAREERERLAALDMIIAPDHPVVSILGGAHFTVRFPTQIKMVCVYSMQGTKMMERYYQDTDTANLDLSALPQGIYAAMALGDDGRLYGLKLYR